MRDDQGRVRITLDERGESGRDRRQPASAVDEDRNAAFRRQREDRREPLVARVEALGPRMELDPARAEVETAHRLLERRLVQVEPHERDQAAPGTGGEGQRPVVRSTKRGVPVGLVEAEHERTGHAVPAHHGLELVVVPDHAVDVPPEVQVGVEDLALRRQQLLHRPVVPGDELERASEGVGHP